MKRFLLTLVTGVLTAHGLTQSATAQAIRNYPLDEYTIQTVPVSRDTVTTVSFPGPITAIQGSRFTTGVSRLDLFQVDYQRGSYFLSLRSLQRGARANLNVIWNRKTYVLDVVDSTEPVLSAMFNFDNRRRPTALPPVTPNRLLGMLDKAKAYPVLAANYPKAVGEIEVIRPGTVTDYPQFTVSVDEVFRFPQQDTLVFKLTFKNKTAEAVTYAPEGLAVRAGDLVFTNAISDASGLIPPNGSAPAYFAITGTPTGGRNDLSVKNEFAVVVSPASAPSLFPTNGGGGRDFKEVVAPAGPSN